MNILFCAAFVILWSPFQFAIVSPVIPGEPIRPLDEKIVGGEVIDIKLAPYQVSLVYNSYFTCGGSIISLKHILTAAHCTRG